MPEAHSVPSTPPPAPQPVPPSVAGLEGASELLGRPEGPLARDPRLSPDEWAGLRGAGVGVLAPAETATPHPAAAPAMQARSLPRAFGRRVLRFLLRLRLPARVGFGGFVAYVLLFSFSVVRGSSMRPGIEDGDRILIDPLFPSLFGIERGDVVVLRCPLDPSLDYIKRVVGLPGDRVVLEEGRLFVNGDEVAEPYVADVDRRSRVRTTVRPDHYFVLGDNRPHSSDSREFGQVPTELLRGTVEVRVWPPDRFGRVR